MCVCLRERESVCMCEKERGMQDTKRRKKYECMRILNLSPSDCVCVCLRERESVCV